MQGKGSAYSHSLTHARGTCFSEWAFLYMWLIQERHWLVIVLSIHTPATYGLYLGLQGCTRICIPRHTEEHRLPVTGLFLHVRFLQLSGVSRPFWTRGCPPLDAEKCPWVGCNNKYDIVWVIWLMKSIHEDGPVHVTPHNSYFDWGGGHIINVQ